MRVKSYKYVIFDFGGVIININYQLTIEAFKKLGIDNFDELYSQAAQSDLFNDIETGKISPQHFINGLLKLLPSGITPNQVVHAWNAMILDVPAHRISFLKELSKTHKIFLLSNTNSIHIDKALIEWKRSTTTAIDELFDHVYLSHEINMRKPHAEIFQHVCNQEGLDPTEGLFIDDSIQHIEGAKSIGLDTIHLTPGMEIQAVLS